MEEGEKERERESELYCYDDTELERICWLFVMMFICQFFFSFRET